MMMNRDYEHDEDETESSIHDLAHAPAVPSSRILASMHQSFEDILAPFGSPKFRPGPERPGVRRNRSSGSGHKYPETPHSGKKRATLKLRRTSDPDALQSSPRPRMLSSGSLPSMSSSPAIRKRSSSSDGSFRLSPIQSSPKSARQRSRSADNPIQLAMEALNASRSFPPDTDEQVTRSPRPLTRRAASAKSRINNLSSTAESRASTIEHFEKIIQNSSVASTQRSPRRNSNSRGRRTISDLIPTNRPSASLNSSAKQQPTASTALVRSDGRPNRADHPMVHIPEVPMTEEEDDDDDDEEEEEENRRSNKDEDDDEHKNDINKDTATDIKKRSPSKSPLTSALNAPAPRALPIAPLSPKPNSAHRRRSITPPTSPRSLKDAMMTPSSDHSSEDDYDEGENEMVNKIQQQQQQQKQQQQQQPHQQQYLSSDDEESQKINTMDLHGGSSSHEPSISLNDESESSAYTFGAPDSPTSTGNYNEDSTTSHLEPVDETSYEDEDESGSESTDMDLVEDDYTSTSTSTNDHPLNFCPQQDYTSERSLSSADYNMLYGGPPLSVSSHTSGGSSSNGNRSKVPRAGTSPYTKQRTYSGDSSAVASEVQQIREVSLEDQERQLKQKINRGSLRSKRFSSPRDSQYGFADNSSVHSFEGADQTESYTETDIYDATMRGPKSIVIFGFKLPDFCSKRRIDMGRVASFVVTKSPCFWFFPFPYSTDKAILFRLNILCAFFALFQLGSTLFFYITLLDPKLAERELRDAEEEIENPTYANDSVLLTATWNPNASILMLGICAFLIIVASGLNVRVIRNVNLLGAIRFLWALIWIIPIEIYCIIALFDYFRTSSVWIKFWWRDRQFGLYRKFFCRPVETANTLCALPVFPTREGEDEWCMTNYNSTDCYEIRKEAQDKALRFFLAFYYANAAWGLCMIVLLFLVVTVLESIISRPLVQKSRESNIPAWLLLPTIAVLAAGSLYAFSTGSVLNTRTEKRSESFWIGPMYITSGALFFVACILGWFMSAYTILSVSDKRRKLASITAFIGIMFVTTFILTAIFSVSVSFSITLWESPITDPTRGSLACYVDQTGVCTGCDQRFDRCPEWEEQDITKIVQGQAKASATLAAICLIYAVGALRFGFNLRNDLAMYQIEYV